ncbi:MAG: lytic transglycosylase domain-containing protein [Cyanobacteria bacterium SIG32]|nr:lytic transglycosylase domain-containing protein [Cyanobacteria bacterium SIG32]
MFSYNNYFNNPFMMNSFCMANYSFNFPMTSFTSYNPFTPNFGINNYNFGLYNNFSFNPINYTMPSLFNYSGVTAMPTFTAPSYLGSNTNIFGFLNNSSIKTTRETSAVVCTTSTSRSEEKSTVKRAALNVSADGLGPEFLAKVKQIASRLNCDYKDLLAVMNSESGLNSKAVNPHGGATGLIQFMPKTAKGLGTTTEALKAMSPVEQLDYVEKYLVQMKKSAGFSNDAKLSGGQLYALVFLPGRANREVLTSGSEKYYTWNTGLDTNKDGKITKTELDRRVASKSVNESVFA